MESLITFSYLNLKDRINVVIKECICQFNKSLIKLVWLLLLLLDSLHESPSTSRRISRLNPSLRLILLAEVGRLIILLWLFWWRSDDLFSTDKCFLEFFDFFILYFINDKKDSYRYLPSIFSNQW